MLNAFIFENLPIVYLFFDQCFSILKFLECISAQKLHIVVAITRDSLNSIEMDVANIIVHNKSKINHQNVMNWRFINISYNIQLSTSLNLVLISIHKLIFLELLMYNFRLVKSFILTFILTSKSFYSRFREMDASQIRYTQITTVQHVFDCCKIFCIS